MMGCSGSGKAQSSPAQQDGKPKTQEEVEALLTNYKISLVFDFPEQLQEPYILTQAANDKGAFFEMKGEYKALMFYDFTAGKAYDLDAETKTGEVEDVDPDNYLAKGMHFYIAQYLFRHTMYDDLKKTGNEKILGRNATVYSAEVYEGEIKFWIDNEYGFALKYEQTGAQKMTMKVTEFIVGGVNLQGLVKLDEFEIVEISDDKPETTTISEALEALKKSAEEAGFTVWGGWSTLTNWTTKSNSKQEPENGFQISVLREGSNFMGIAVLEFANEEVAKEYLAFAASEDAYFSGKIHRSGVFTVVIAEILVEENEAKLMEALRKAGWE
jgi:hypothetical protein